MLAHALWHYWKIVAALAEQHHSSSYGCGVNSLWRLATSRLVLVSMLPALAVVVGSNRDYHQWWQQTTSDRRWTHYYDMLTHSAVAAELRLFDLQIYFRRLIKRCVNDWLVSVSC